MSDSTIMRYVHARRSVATLLSGCVNACTPVSTISSCVHARMGVSTNGDQCHVEVDQCRANIASENVSVKLSTCIRINQVDQMITFTYQGLLALVLGADHLQVLEKHNYVLYCRKI